MKPTVQRAYVLHRRPYRETSAIVDFFCEVEGRIAAVVKGVQKSARPRSGFAALCQPAQCVRLSWQGRSELKTVLTLEMDSGFVSIRGERLYSVLYCNELLTRLLAQHDPHPNLFSAYKRLLNSLAAMKPLEPALRRFELTLIEELGYGFALDRVADSGAPLDAHQHYRFVPEHGLVEASDEESHGAYEGAHLLNIASDRLEDLEVARTAKRLMREVLQQLVGDHPLASRELFRRR